MKNYMKEIAGSPLFDGFKREELETMLECAGAAVREYRKEEIIILSDDEVRYIGVVLRGSVHMIKENSMGDRTLLSIMGKGEVFGESFACGDELTSYATFVAVCPTTVLFMPFQKVMYSCDLRCVFHHRMIENMVTMIANKNVRLMQKIDVSSQKTLREKILAYLRLLEKEQKSQVVELPISRTLLAEYLSVNRSALSRELALMREEGLLEIEKNRFWLKQLGEK